MAGIYAPAATSSNSQSNKSGSTADAVNNIDLGSFLTLMIKELQNQDPLNPMDNKDMLTQLSQIRQVGATDKLTSTLDSVLLGQNISSATNLIGAQVTGITDAGDKVNGLVDRIAIDKGKPMLHVENPTGLATSSADGDMEAGKYSYRVVWEDGNQNLIGFDFSGTKGIETNGEAGVDRAVTIGNLPETSGRKQIYRTDKTGEGGYQLVGTVDGKSSSFTDTFADKDRNGQTLTRAFTRSSVASRSYDVGLTNVSLIEPPKVNSN